MFFTSAERKMLCFYCVSLRLSACPLDYSKSYELILMKFLGWSLTQEQSIRFWGSYREKAEKLTLHKTPNSFMSASLVKSPTLDIEYGKPDDSFLKDFYRAIHVVQERYCYRMLYVRLSVALLICDHTCWASSARKSLHE